jgi:integrase
VLPAAFVKNRKEQPRPLHPELVAELQKLKAAGKLKPEDIVFPERVPPMKVIRADFQAAGIPLTDERGHRVDFHALRTTYITRLQRAGVSPRVGFVDVGARVRDGRGPSRRNHAHAGWRARRPRRCAKLAEQRLPLRFDGLNLSGVHRCLAGDVHLAP